MGESIMANLFSGLEALGLKKLSEMNIYESKQEVASSKAVSAEKPTMTEEDIIFDKTHMCPACDNEFKSKMVKAGKVKLQALDTDLRPKYMGVDPLKYDAILCPHCGYTALNRYFKYLTTTQSKLIKEAISSSFRGVKEGETILSYDDAITRHKLALVNAIVKRAKTSEKAYICIKTAWLLRGKKESLPKETPNYNKIIADLEKEEYDFIEKAYEGFDEAFSKENFPMCGMDENTLTVLIADLARKIGKTEEAGRWISKILVSKDANDRIKEKARDIKELMKEEK